MSQPINEVEVRSWRLHTLAAVVIGCLIVLVARLFFLQVVQHEHYRALAAEERWRRDSIPAERGQILDATGEPLVVSVPYETLYAVTENIVDPEQVASALAPIIGEPVDALADVLRTKSTVPTVIKRRIPADVADQIRALKFVNVYLVAEPIRQYPNGTLAAPLLGVVGVDGKGLSGIELAFDEALAGQPGWVYAERDTGGDEIAFGLRESQPPVDGASLRLTIDAAIQRIAERELAATLERHGATGGAIIVLDPRTGEVLALASHPTYDPNDPDLFATTPIEHFRVPPVQDIYEPGPVFSAITMAAAFDARVVEPDTAIWNSGSFRYAGGTIVDPDVRSPGPETMLQAIERSSTIGVSYAATRLGADRFYSYIRSFGFGSPTDIGLPGESGGLMRTPEGGEWYPFDLATNSYGQGISVTPLQLASAFAAIANGGTLMKPMIVHEMVGPNGRQTFAPVVVRQAIRADTARQMSEILVQMIEREGSGIAGVPGYRLGGTAGLAQVPGESGYVEGAQIATFAGFGPAEDPRFVVLIKIDEPQDASSAEAVVAPAFQALARELFVHFRVPPQETESQ